MATMTLTRAQFQLRTANVANQRRTCVRAANTEQFQQSPPPPPPPPPPRPPQQSSILSRRGLLGYVGVGAGAGALGYLIGSQTAGSGEPSLSGLTAEDRKEIDELRAEAQFRRDYDGHVWVQTRNGQWCEIRLDAQVPGLVLIRDPDGFIRFLSLSLQQIDLTDDFVVISIFGDGSWEANAQRLQVKDDAGDFQDARMDQESFRDLISIKL